MHKNVKTLEDLNLTQEQKTSIEAFILSEVTGGIQAQANRITEEVTKAISAKVPVLSTPSDKSLKVANWALVGVLGATLVTGIVRSVVASRQGGGVAMGANAPGQ